MVRLLRLRYGTLVCMTICFPISLWENVLLAVLFDEDNKEIYLAETPVKKEVREEVSHSDWREQRVIYLSSAMWEMTVEACLVGIAGWQNMPMRVMSVNHLLERLREAEFALRIMEAVGPEVS